MNVNSMINTGSSDKQAYVEYSCEFDVCNY